MKTNKAILYISFSRLVHWKRDLNSPSRVLQNLPLSRIELNILHSITLSYKSRRCVDWLLLNSKMSSQIDVQLKDPFSMLMAGERGAGKTTFTKKLLKEENWLIHPTPQRVIWCYAKQQPNLLSDLKKILPAIEYVQDIPSEMDSMFDRSVNNLMIFCNMMDEVTQDKRISQLFTRGRHDNLSVIYLTQYLFDKTQREISVNSDYMVVFKNPRDKTQFTNLARQFMPRKFFYYIFY